MRIAHDPGHGMAPAVVGVIANGIRERDTVYSIALDIAAGIPGFDHVMLRKPDGTPDYTERAQKALTMQASLVLCHHINEDKDPTSRGLMTFYDPTDVVGKAAAEAISDASPPLLQRAHGYRCFPMQLKEYSPGAQWVIEHYRELGLSCCLIEWGFASYPSDAAFLLNAKCRPGLVAAAYAGIARAAQITHVSPDELVCQP